MKEIRWNALKSEQLKKSRGVSFEEVLSSKLVDILEHPSRPLQSILVYEYKGYLWAVPFVKEESHIFLKTIYPSRKLMKRYKRKGI